MIMRKYLVTIHEDGRLTASEYEEPTGYTYSVEGNVYRAGYNQALIDVKTILDAEEDRCETNSRIKKFGQGWITCWAGRAVECDLLKTSIDKLFASLNGTRR